MRGIASSSGLFGTRSGLLRVATFVFASVAAAAPARADWAFTHWGMTPDQVVAASGGAVQLVPQSERTRNDADHWEVSVMGHYREDGLSYPVGFMFDTDGHGLTCVLYNATGDDVQKLSSKLMARLGKPEKDSDFETARDLIWNQGDKIELVINQKPLAAAVTHCSPDH